MIVYIDKSAVSPSDEPHEGERVQCELVSVNELGAKLARQLGAGELTPERVEAAYFGWRQHACKAKNSRTQVMNIDNYFNGKLREQGYELMIYPVNKGKVRWRVAIVPLQKTLLLTDNETGTDKGGGTHNVENDCPTHGGHEDLRQRVHERRRDTDALHLSGP